MPKKYIFEFVKQYFQKEKCILLSIEYKNIGTKLKYIAQCNHESYISFDCFKNRNQGRNCPDCRSNSPLKYEDVKKYFKDNKCFLLTTTYSNNTTKLKFIATCGHEYITTFSSFRHGNNRICLDCSLIRSGKNKKPLENEIFKDIPGFENRYRVSNLGNIYSKVSKLYLKPTDMDGYERIRLKDKNNIFKNFRIHRLVVLTFIGEIRYKSIDHINRIKNDNRLENLRIVNHNENMKNRSTKNMGKKIIQYDLNDNFIKEYDSISQAARGLDCSPSSIGNCVCGRTKTSQNYKWKFKNTEPFIKKKNEIFKNIGKLYNKDFSNYEVSNYGNFYNIKLKILLKKLVNGGYYNVTLNNKSYRSHRIVAEIFVSGKTKSRNQVHHKNENKLDNFYENLEWTTNKENVTYSFGKKVKQIDIDTNKIIKIFDSVASASKEVSTKDVRSCIRKVCNKYLTRSCGYKWEWG